jgi:hypothetical protein
MTINSASNVTEANSGVRHRRYLLAYYLFFPNALSAFLEEFRRFIIQNKIVELGVAFVVGRSYNYLVKSFINDILVGPVGLLIVG